MFCSYQCWSCANTDSVMCYMANHFLFSCVVCKLSCPINCLQHSKYFLQQSPVLQQASHHGPVGNVLLACTLLSKMNQKFTQISTIFSTQSTYVHLRSYKKKNDDHYFKEKFTSRYIPVPSTVSMAIFTMYVSEHFMVMEV